MRCARILEEMETLGTHSATSRRRKPKRLVMSTFYAAVADLGRYTKVP